MMVLKFNKFERIAGAFILVAVVGSVMTAVSVAVKQGWFEKKTAYSTHFENADGIHPGTVVQMAGLRVGEVEDVELQGDNTIKVNFYILGKYQKRIRNDSKAQLIRPFIIGERVLEVSVGSDSEAELAENSLMKSEESMDIMTIISGKKLGSYFGRISSILENLNEVISALMNKERTQTMVKMFDKLDPLITNLNLMTIEMTRMSQEVNLILPELNKTHPKMGRDLAMITKNLASVADQLRVLGPVMDEIGDQLPATARRAVEALNEATILIKAMQKSFFVRSSVAEVRDEEAKDPNRRTPASKAKKP